jgi:hypothetical protein
MSVKKAKRKVVKRRKLTAKQIKYFGTKAQKAALKRKRSAATTHKTTKKTTKKTKKKTVKKNTNTVSTLGAIGIGLAGAAAGYVAGTALSDQTNALLNNLATGNIPIISGIASGLAKTNPTPTESAWQAASIASGESASDLKAEFSSPEAALIVANNINSASTQQLINSLNKGDLTGENTAKTVTNQATGKTTANPYYTTSVGDNLAYALYYAEMANQK